MAAVAAGGVYLVLVGTGCAAVMACGGPASSASRAPSATVAAGPESTSTTTVSPTTTSIAPAPPPMAATTAEQQVEDAYLRSWDVYRDAVLHLDPSRLEEAYSGLALETRRNEIADLSALNTPIRVDLEHDYEIALVSTDDALVFESYRNHSVFLDGRTMEPIEPDPNEVLKREYVLHRGSSGWRVSGINAGS